MSYTYELVADELIKDIENKVYAAGKKLPSVRELSKVYNCSNNTIVKAFDFLKNKHIIYSIPQSGFYIVENKISNNHKMSDIINFSTGNLIIGNMNTPDLKHCLDRAVDIYTNNSLINTSGGGVASLKNVLPNYLSNFQIFTSPHNIFINLGIQQVLSIISKMDFPNGKIKILIEDPTYRYFSEFLRYSNLEVVTINRDEKGIDLKILEQLFKDNSIKFFYTVPRNHNPLGTSYTTKQNKEIAKLAIKYDVFIVEDDYFGDLSNATKYDPIFSFGDRKHFIYLKSFSKILPWIRLGLSIMPDCLLESFKYQIELSYYTSYFTASLISQATFEIYIRSGILFKHTASMKKEIEEKSILLQQNLKRLKRFDIKPIGGKNCFYCYLLLPDYVDEKKLMEALKNRKVLVSPGDKYYYDKENYKKGIRLSIACVSTQEIKIGMDIIVEELEKTIKL